MIRSVFFCVAFFTHLVHGCLPGTGLGGYPTSYPQYAYNYNPYGASYGVPYKSRHEPSVQASDTKTALLASTDGTDGCVTKFDNSRLTCATSFEKRPMSTEAECQRLCFENILKCQSFEFSSLTATCDLYSVPPPEGVLVASRRRPQSPFADQPLTEQSDYSYKKKLRRKRQFNLFDEKDPLKLPQFPNYCEPEVVPALGSIFFVPNLDCAPSSQFTATSAEIEPFSRQQRLPNSVQIMPTSNPPNGQINIIPEMPDCRDGGRARIQLIDGIAFVPEKPAVAKIQVESADVCLLLCRNNAYLDGSRFQKPCVAATFDRGSGRCTIMDEAISPNGNLQYTPHADSVYFEKMCIPVTELPMNCDDVVHRIPQRVLQGQADATVDAPSQTECIRRCITASRLLGFTCQSATYYFEFPSQNCILNRFTRVSRPESFQAELRQKVDYMELAPCMISGFQQRDAAWSDWSDCDGSQTRVRKRNCTDCDNKEEVSPCVASKAFQQEFPVITKDIDADLIPVERKIASNFDSVKNLRKQEVQKIPSDERSLFGEHDYENQNEISYFGPPRGDHKDGVKSNEVSGRRSRQEIEDITADALKELELKAMHEAAGQMEGFEDEAPEVKDQAVLESPVIRNLEPESRGSSRFFSSSGPGKNSKNEEETYESRLRQNHLGDGVAVVEFPQTAPPAASAAVSGYGQSNLDQETYEGFRRLPAVTSTVPTTTTTGEGQAVGRKPVQLGLIPAADTLANCDPKKDCCPLVEFSGRQKRGCTVGYRINENHQQEGCVPEDCRHKSPVGFRFYI